MEALLGASNNNRSCGSIADFQEQLRDIFKDKVTESRAEHLSLTFELRSTAVFHIPVTETDNEALEQASNIDPLLGGARSSSVPNPDGTGGQPARQINAIDTLINQPRDDHVLQNSVSKHIISSLSEIDGSNWTVRQVSRNEQGWTFTYICKDSWTAWSRQAAKNPPKLVVGEWSSKDGQDPVNLSRPAFDCRGSVTVSFLKSNKVIEVNYEHTPLHKTVAQLVELLIPPPAALNPKPQKKAKEPKPPKEPRPPKAPRPPKEPKAPRPPKTPRSSKKRQAENGAAEGEGSQAKKRRKKKKDAAPGPDGMLPPEMPGALPVGQGSGRTLYNSGNGDQQNGYGNYPEGLVGANDDGTRSESQGAVSAHGGIHSHSILNLAPEEAARRREVAINLLNSQNIDPQTLSPEQFSIFANQSPELQKESLAMLVKYGAERLRIVHPNKDAPRSNQSTPARETTEGAGTKLAQTTPQGGSPSTPSKSKRSRKKKLSEAIVTEEMETDTDAPVTNVATASMPKQKLTRGSCESCRAKKAKCDKRKPSCGRCVIDSTDCYYAPAKPRGSRGPKAVEEEPELEVVNVPDEEEPDDLGSPGFNSHSQPEPVNVPPAELPPAEMESTPDEPPVTYPQPPEVYQHMPDLTFPHSTDDPTPEVVQPNLPSASMDYVHTSVADTSLHNFSYPPQSEPLAVTDHQASSLQQPTTIQPSAIQRDHHTTSTHIAPTSSTRRSLPTSQPSQASASNTQTNAPMDPWQTIANPPAVAAQPTRTSPRQTRAKKPVQNTVAPAYDDLRQSSNWSSQPATQATTQQMQNTTPYQTAVHTTRAKSRQGNRSQTQTPVQNMSTTNRISQSKGSQSIGTDNSGYGSNVASTNDGSYDTYGQYNTRAATNTASNRISYEPYAHNPSAVSNSYYDDYNTRSTNNNASATIANPVSSHAAAATAAGSSYGTTTAAASNSSSQWGTPSTQTRSTRSAYDNSGQAAAAPSANTSYNTTQQQQSQNLQGFNVRPQPPTSVQTRSAAATNAYSQQSQPQQTQQRQQSYSYSSQPARNSTASQQQQQQQQQQQNWYSYGSTGGSGSGGNTGYSSNTGGTHAQQQHSHTHHQPTHSGHGNAHAHGGHASNTSAAAQYSQAQQQHHHRSMNLSSHTYSSGDGADTALYDLLGHGHR